MSRMFEWLTSAVAASRGRDITASSRVWCLASAASLIYWSSSPPSSIILSDLWLSVCPPPICLYSRHPPSVSLQSGTCISATGLIQLGAVLYGMLDRHTPFDTLKFHRDELPISSELSQSKQCNTLIHYVYIWLSITFMWCPEGFMAHQTPLDWLKRRNFTFSG